jgi:hypothetical protein
MSENLEIVILIGLPALLSAILSFIGVLLTIASHKKMDSIEVHINGHLDKILTKTEGREEDSRG